MLSFHQLQPAQQQAAIDHYANVQLQAVTVGAVAFADPELYAKVQAANEQAERMGTPWFAASYVWEAVGDEITAHASRMAHAAMYLEPDDPDVVDINDLKVTQ